MVEKIQAGNTNEYPLISVLSLTYKNFQNIYDAIKSILEQDYPRIELIISDDGSPNFFEERDQMEEYIGRFRRKNLESFNISHLNENMGTVKNLNNAFSLAEGKYVIGISDDIFYKKNSLSNLVNYAEKASAQITASRTIQFSEKTSIEYPTEKEMAFMEKLSPEELKNLLCFKCCISAPGVLYNRDFIEGIGLFDESYTYMEDYPLWLKVSKMGYKINFFNEVTVKYRLGGFSNGDSPVTQIFNEERKKFIKEEILEYSKKNNSKLLSCFLFRNYKKVLYYIEKPHIARLKKQKKAFYALRFLDVYIYEYIYRKYLRMKY